MENVCPNCGGGFSPRPVRPSVARRSGVSLRHQAASKERIHTKYTEEDIRMFARSIKNIPAGER